MRARALSSTSLRLSSKTARNRSQRMCRLPFPVQRRMGLHRGQIRRLEGLVETPITPQQRLRPVLRPVHGLEGVDIWLPHQPHPLAPVGFDDLTLPDHSVQLQDQRPPPHHVPHAACPAARYGRFSSPAVFAQTAHGPARALPQRGYRPPFPRPDDLNRARTRPARRSASPPASTGASPETARGPQVRPRLVRAATSTPPAPQRADFLRECRGEPHQHFPRTRVQLCASERGPSVCTGRPTPYPSPKVPAQEIAYSSRIRCLYTRQGIIAPTPPLLTNDWGA